MSRPVTLNLMYWEVCGYYSLDCASRTECLAGVCETRPCGQSCWMWGSPDDTEQKAEGIQWTPRMRLIRNLRTFFCSGHSGEISSFTVRAKKCFLSPLTQEGFALLFVLWGCPRDAVLAHNSVTVLCQGWKLRNSPGFMCYAWEWTCWLWVIRNYILIA